MPQKHRMDHDITPVMYSDNKISKSAPPNWQICQNNLLYRLFSSVFFKTSNYCFFFRKKKKLAKF